MAYPESARRAAVTAELAGISDLLVQKRLAQVQVFRQLGRWQAVATVLDGVLEDEPGSALVPDVLWERARAAEKLDDTAGATRFYSRLASDFPQSRHADSATEAAARLKAGAGS